MTLILSNNDVATAFSVTRCLDVMEESYREQAESRAVNRRRGVPRQGSAALAQAARLHHQPSRDQ